MPAISPMAQPVRQCSVALSAMLKDASWTCCGEACASMPATLSDTPMGYSDRMEMRGYTASKDQLLNRLRRIEGQVRGVERMVDEDRYCIDVVTQISAVQAALDKVALGLIDGHTRHCVMGAEPDEREAKTDELMTAVGRLVRRS